MLVPVDKEFGRLKMEKIQYYKSRSNCETVQTTNEVSGGIDIGSWNSKGFSWACYPVEPTMLMSPFFE